MLFLAKLPGTSVAIVSAFFCNILVVTFDFFDHPNLEEMPMTRGVKKGSQIDRIFVPPSTFDPSFRISQSSLDHESLFFGKWMNRSETDF